MRKRSKRRKIQRRHPDKVPPQLPKAKGRIIRRRPDTLTNRRKFTRSRRRVLIEALSAGISITRACGLAGISPDTYRKWLELGKDKSRPTYNYFRRKVKQIEHKKELEALETIRKAYQGGKRITERKITIGPKGIETTVTTKELMPQWTAAAWRLERLYPEEYGRNKQGTDNEKTVEETARDIKAAADILFNTVPNVHNGMKPPEDMPD